MFSLDTNICIYTLNNHPVSLRDKFIRFKNEISISAIVYAELFYGVKNTVSKSLRVEREVELREFISLVKIEPWNELAAEHYGEIRTYLRNKGQTIGNMDMLIAAHARSSNKILVTNNEREFNRIPDLLLENWTK
jgi:tRNA(fMet)-specific endonuclease VapC